MFGGGSAAWDREVIDSKMISAAGLKLSRCIGWEPENEAWAGRLNGGLSTRLSMIAGKSGDDRTERSIFSASRSHGFGFHHLVQWHLTYVELQYGRRLSRLESSCS